MILTEVSFLALVVGADIHGDLDLGMWSARFPLSLRSTFFLDGGFHCHGRFALSDRGMVDGTLGDRRRKRTIGLRPL